MSFTIMSAIGGPNATGDKLDALDPYTQAIERMRWGLRATPVHGEIANSTLTTPTGNSHSVEDAPSVDRGLQHHAMCPDINRLASETTVSSIEAAAKVLPLNSDQHLDFPEHSPFRAVQMGTSHDLLSLSHYAALKIGSSPLA